MREIIADYKTQIICYAKKILWVMCNSEEKQEEINRNWQCLMKDTSFIR